MTEVIISPTDQADIQFQLLRHATTSQVYEARITVADQDKMIITRLTLTDLTIAASTLAAMADEWRRDLERDNE